jgi:ATP-dependent DNA helicase RecG
MKNNDMVSPTLKSLNKSFSITLYYRHVYSKEEQLWLENFKAIELSREQLTVIRLGVNGRLVSAKEIFESVGIVDEKSYRELIESLRSTGLLETTLSGEEVTNQKRKFGGLRKAVPRYTIRIPNQGNPQHKSGDERSEYARIYVGNVPYNASEEEISAALSKFGEVVDVIIPRWTNGNTKGFCFVEFDKRLQANNALNSPVPIFLSERKLYLREVEKIK